MSAVSLADWGRHMDAGETTYAVGQVPAAAAVYVDQAEAEAAAAADELDGTYIEWTGHTGHQVVTAEREAETEAYIDAPEPELDL